MGEGEEYFQDSTSEGSAAASRKAQRMLFRESLR